LEGPSIALDVTDTGPGLSECQVAYLFEPFNRLGAEHTSVEGTGIGLVIVHKLVELMGGRMAVSSRPGLGTTFTVTLPSADVGPDSEHGALDEPVAQARHATVLYAEDNEVNVMLVRQILAMRGTWRLVVARNGAEAIELARQCQPDLLLLDMHLGDMTGFELVDELARQGLAQGVPLVALSADAMPDRIHAAQGIGFSHYLTKPLDVAALLRCLDEHLA